MNQMFDEIVTRYYNVILNYCKYKLNGNKTAAEDVTQDVFFILYRKRNRITMGANIKLWLYRTADNQIKTYIRKNPAFQKLDDLPEIVVDEIFPSVTDSIFECLTTEEIALLTDYYNNEKTEVARKNNLSMNGLYIRTHRIRKKLADNAVKMNKIKL